MDSQPSLLITGSNGLIGSKLVSDFESKYLFEKVDISDPIHPVDITQLDQVLETFEASEATAVVHFAAFTDVTAAWKQRDDKSGSAYMINVAGTDNIVAACERTNKHLIHISTAYVFDGKKDGMYVEDDTVNPIEWYGYTKANAEEVVQSCKTPWTILRIDQPFRSDAFPRPDIVRKIAQGLQQSQLMPQFTNHFFGPTYIDDLAKVIEWVVRSKATGLYHASSGEQWTDYEFAKAIQKIHQLPGQVAPGDLADYLESLERPYQANTAMSVDKLKKELDFELLSIQQALAEVRL